MLIDIILLGLMIMAVVRGIQKGFIVALFSMIGFIVGLVAALKLSTVVAAYLDESVNVSARWPFLAFALVFIAVVLLVRLLAAVIQSTMELVDDIKKFAKNFYEKFRAIQLKEQSKGL